MDFRIGARRVYYDLVGPAGAPVVCCVHSLAADSGVWSDQVPPLLQSGFRVLRLDLRGHGGSDPGEGDYSMSGLAQDVIAALDFLGIERMHFLGVSIGGMIGQTLGIEHGSRLLSLTLCDTAPAAMAGAAALWETRFAAIRAAGSVEPLADETMRRWLTEAFASRRPDRWREIRETIAATRPQGYLGAAAALIAFDVTARLPSVTTPTLVICGADDTGSPPAGNRLIASLIPGARYAEMAEARHLPMLERPEEFNALLIEWLGAQRLAPQRT
jgi:3-oxoadipate enol-lactonase